MVVDRERCSSNDVCCMPYKCGRSPPRSSCEACPRTFQPRCNYVSTRRQIPQPPMPPSSVCHPPQQPTHLDHRPTCRCDIVHMYVYKEKHASLWNRRNENECSCEESLFGPLWEDVLTAHICSVMVPLLRPSWSVDLGHGSLIFHRRRHNNVFLVLEETLVSSDSSCRTCIS